MSRLARGRASARRTTGLALGIALLATACADRAAPTAPAGAGTRPSADVGVSQQIRLDFVVFAPCANNGEGEPIFFRGTLHRVIAEQPSAAGVYAYHVGYNPQGATGYGPFTGTTYRAIGISVNTGIILGPTETGTLVNNFRVIGPGLTANLLIQLVIHATVNANGEVTESFENATAECLQG